MLTKEEVASEYPWLKPGVIVNYHGVIGGPVTQAGLEVLTEPYQLPSKDWVVTLKGKSGCVSVDALTLSPMSPPVADPNAWEDKVAAVEEDIRASTLVVTEHLLVGATKLLKLGPRAASRGLHLIAGLTKLQQTVLTLLGVEGPRKHPGRAAYAPLLGSSADEDLDLVSESDTYPPSPVMAETYGGQAMQQLVTAFKPLVESQINAKKPAPSTEVEELTRALSAAKSARFEKKLVDKIQAALTSSLERLGAPTPPAQPEEEAAS